MLCSVVVKTIVFPSNNSNIISRRRFSTGDLKNSSLLPVAQSCCPWIIVIAPPLSTFRYGLGFYKRRCERDLSAVTVQRLWRRQDIKSPNRSRQRHDNETRVICSTHDTRERAHALKLPSFSICSICN